MVEPKYLIPSEFLRTWIDSYWFIDSQVALPTGPLLPLGYPIIEFNLGAPWYFSTDEQSWQKLDNVLIRVTDKPIYLMHNGTIRSVLVRFKPWGVLPFAPMPSKSNPPYETIDPLDQNFADLAIQLRRAETQLETKSLLDAQFTNIFQTSKGQLDHRISKSIKYILERNGNLRVSKLAKKFGCTSRRLSQIFYRAFGISIKRYCRVARWQYALSLLKNQPRLTDISHQAGYYDQAHFIRECRKITHFSPSTYFANHLAQNHEISNLYNYD